MVRCFGIGGAHVPVGDQLHAVGIDGREQEDVVVEDAQGLRIAAAQEVVGLGEEGLGGDDFVGVQAAIDPDDGLAFGGEGVGLIVGEAFGAGEALGDLFVARQVFEIGRRGDDGHDDGAAFGGLADLFEFDAVGFGGDLVPVVEQLGVVGEEIVVAGGIGAEDGRGDFRLGRARRWRPGRRIRQRPSCFIGAAFAWMMRGFGRRTPVPYFSMVRVFML